MFWLNVVFVGVWFGVGVLLLLICRIMGGRGEGRDLDYVGFGFFLSVVGFRVGMVVVVGFVLL